MNRRVFFKKLVLGTAVFTILPPATTYSRIWKARREVTDGLPGPYYEIVTWEPSLVDGGEVLLPISVGRSVDYDGRWAWNVSQGKWVENA